MLTLAVPHMHVFPEEEDYTDQEVFEDDFARAEAEYEQNLGLFAESRQYMRFT